MLLCLNAPPSAPPRNALSKQPRIARLIGLYSQCKNMGSLPEDGGVLDMRADHYAFFGIFGNAEAEHLANQ